MSSDLQGLVLPKKFDISKHAIEKIEKFNKDTIELLIPLPVVANLYVLSIVATLSIALSHLLKNKCDVKITFLLLTEQTNHSNYINGNIKKHLKTVMNHKHLFAMTENLRTAEFKSLINLILLSLSQIDGMCKGKENVMKEMILSKVHYCDIDEYIETVKILPKTDELKEQNIKSEIDEYLKLFIQRSFLFSWDEISKNDDYDKRFKKLLAQKLGLWIQYSNINKNDNNKTICLSTETNSLLLTLKNDKKVKLENGNHLMDQFMECEKNDNQKLEIYGKGYSNCLFNQLSSIIKHCENDNLSSKKILFVNDDLSGVLNVNSDNFVLLGYQNPINQMVVERMGGTILTFVTPTSKYINNARNFVHCIDEFYFSGLFPKFSSKLFKTFTNIENIPYIKSDMAIAEDSDISVDKYSLVYRKTAFTKHTYPPIEAVAQKRRENIQNVQKDFLGLINGGFLTVQNNTMAELKLLL